MERKIGEIFEYNGEWYQCVESDCCAKCSLRTTECGSGTKSDLADEVFGECSKIRRSDSKHAIFKKLEKVGEPYEFDGHLFQSYRTFEVPIFTENYATVRELGNNSKISIEIKQTKEDMEENRTINQQFTECEQTINDVVRKCYTENKSTQIKDMEEKYKAENTPLTRLVGRYVNNLIDYDVFEKAVKELYTDKEESKPNLKPFDLEAAKAGNPVCTRDGRKARIICFDRDWDMHIVALVSDPLGESVHYYLSNGKVDFDRQLDEDLMMLSEKKEGWINVYKMKESTFGYITAYFDTEEKAKEDKEQLTGYVATVKINWEE